MKSLSAIKNGLAYEKETAMYNKDELRKARKGQQLNGNSYLLKANEMCFVSIGR
jgi:hypothetical protein